MVPDVDPYPLIHKTPVFGVKKSIMLDPFGGSDSDMEGEWPFDII